MDQTYAADISGMHAHVATGTLLHAISNLKLTNHQAGKNLSFTRQGLNISPTASRLLQTSVDITSGLVLTNDALNMQYMQQCRTAP